MLFVVCLAVYFLLSVGCCWSFVCLFGFWLCVVPFAVNWLIFAVVGRLFVCLSVFVVVVVVVVVVCFLFVSFFHALLLTAG